MDVALITMSYSLSMMETFYPLVDHLTELLSPIGIIGIVTFMSAPNAHLTPPLKWVGLCDGFGVSGSIWIIFTSIPPGASICAINLRYSGFLLSLSRCLDCNSSIQTFVFVKCVDNKSLSCRNQFIKPIVQIPYYIWIGAKRDLSLDPADANQRLQPNKQT